MFDQHSFQELVDACTVQVLPGGCLTERPCVVCSWLPGQGGNGT